MYVQSLPGIAPPSLSAYQSLWPEILYYTLFRFTARNCGEEKGGGTSGGLLYIQ